MIKPTLSACLAVVMALVAGTSAFLVVAIQPALAGTLLPYTGGNATLWQCLQALFQILLLIGYLTAGWCFGLRSRTGVYVGLAMAGVITAVAVPLAPTVASDATLSASSAVLRAGVRLAPTYAMLATTSIVCQFLYLRLGRMESPVWLYAASNTGSLAAVVAYPIWVQPNVDLSVQVDLWRGGAMLVLCSLAALALITRRARTSLTIPPKPASLKHRALWFLGGAAPVGLSLSCTTFLARDLGSHPIVWLGPFSLYLTTLILAFGRPNARVILIACRLAPAAAGMLLVGLLNPWGNTVASYATHVLLVGILLAQWHHWLASQAPSRDNLAAFYVHSILGGTAVSAFLGLAAPIALDPSRFGDPNSPLHRLIFGSLVPEYLLCLLVSIVLVIRVGRTPEEAGGGFPAVAMRVAEGAALGIGLYMCSKPAITAVSTGSAGPWFSWMGLLVLLAAANLLRGGVRVSAAAAAIVIIAFWQVPASARVIEQGRSAFGTIQVSDNARLRTLTHGTTLHGLQPLGCEDNTQRHDCQQPGSYYSPSGPIGRAYALLRSRGVKIDTGVIGLGAGTMAAYCRDADTMIFLEIDPLVVSIAERRFTFLSNARRQCAGAQVRIGDARSEARRLQTGALDLLVGDAFSSDSVPVHLLTREALVEYARLLRSDGVMALHVSSRYLSLDTTVLATARAAGLLGIVVADRMIVSEDKNRSASVWVFLTKSGTALEQLTGAMSRANAGFTVSTGGPGVVWTDERHSLLRLFRW